MTTFLFIDEKQCWQKLSPSKIDTDNSVTDMVCDLRIPVFNMSRTKGLKQIDNNRKINKILLSSFLAKLY